MPNHTDNRVILSHDDSQQIDNIYNVMNTDDTELCNYLVPEPRDDAGEPTSGWYDWRLQHWGTKWDIDPKEGLEFTDNGDGTAQISGWFESAWAPPIEAYNTFVEDMDGCSLVADYHEPGMDFAGFYDNGDDEYMEGLGEYCEQVVKGTTQLEDTPQLFQRLDEQFELVENAREWIEENEEETVNG